MSVQERSVGPSGSRGGFDGATPAPGSRELPLVHRLAMAYLLAPVAVWLLGWFHWWVGVPATALLVVGVWKALSGSWRMRRPSRTAVVLAAVAGAWVMTTPTGGVFTFWGGGDWDMHRAVLLDMTRDGWPTYPVDYLRDAPPLLRYYLGWYMVPSLAARWLGPATLNWAVPLWTWCGVVLVVLLFARGLPTLRAALLAVAVLVFFSGMDIVELALREGVPDAVRMVRDKLDPNWASPSMHRRLEFLRTASSPMFLEYQSHTLTLQLTPQHFLPAGLATLLILQLRKRRRFLEAIGVVVAACLFWSPLLATGLLVLALATLAKNRNARHVASWRNVFVAVPLAALIALYLTSGQIDFERGWLWELYDDRLQLASDVLLLYATEFLVLAALVWWADPQVLRQPLFVAAVAMLLVAPWYYYGTAVYSQWSIRFTVPALVVLAYWAARAVVGRRSEPQARPAHRAVLAVLAAGAVTVVWEIGLMMHNPHPQRYETLGASLMIDARPMWARQRATLSVSERLAPLLREHEPDEADKGTLLIRSAYDVYLRHNRLMYVKDRCRPGDGQTRTRFYADIHPADLRGREAGDPERIVFDLAPRWHYRDGGGCVVPVQLPDYEVARIETGQTAADGHLLWEAEAHLTPNPPAPVPGTVR